MTIRLAESYDTAPDTEPIPPAPVKLTVLPLTVDAKRSVLKVAVIAMLSDTPAELQVGVLKITAGIGPIVLKPHENG